MRFVIVHNHVFKNAGSTIDAVFAKAGFRITPIEASAEHPVVYSRRIVEVVLADEAIEYVTSHSLREPRPPDVEDLVFLDITFVRHPFDRLYSIYTYFTQSGVHDFPQIAKSASFAGFVEGLRRHAPAHLHSPQTVCLGNFREFFYPPGEAELARALGAVATTRFLGVVDLFDQSFRAFLASCRPLLASKDTAALDGPFEAVNGSSRVAEALPDRLDRIERELGPGLHRFLETAMGMDLRLYHFAREEVVRRHTLLLGAA